MDDARGICDEIDGLMRAGGVATRSCDVDRELVCGGRDRTHSSADRAGLQGRIDVKGHDALHLVHEAFRNELDGSTRERLLGGLE